MSTHAAAGGAEPQGEPAQPGPDDGLTFVVRDLRPPRPYLVGSAAPLPPVPGVAPPPPTSLPTPAAPPIQPVPHDGFVIREPQGSSALAPVDAIVVGAPPAPPRPEVPIAANPGFGVTSEVPASPNPSAGPTPNPGFRVHSMVVARSDAPAPAAELPWTVREPAPAATPAQGWSPRRSQAIERNTADVLRRLREDAVLVAWKSAWIAVVTADDRLYRTRGS